MTFLQSCTILFIDSSYITKVFKIRSHGVFMSKSFLSMTVAARIGRKNRFEKREALCIFATTTSGVSTFSNTLYPVTTIAENPTYLLRSRDGLTIDAPKNSFIMIHTRFLFIYFSSPAINIFCRFNNFKSWPIQYKLLHLYSTVEGMFHPLAFVQ